MTNRFKVAVLVGSLRTASINRRLAKALVLLGKDKFDAHFVEIGDLPLFNQDLESNFPASAKRMKQEIESSDAVLIVTPEYNRSIPAPLKNALDWASRPYGQNSFAKKPAAVIGASIGAIGTACAQHNLRPALAYLDVFTMNQPEAYIHFKEGLIDENGMISNEGTKQFLTDYVNHFATFVQQLKAK